MPNELQEKAKAWLRSIKANPGVLGAYPSDRRLSSFTQMKDIERPEPAPIANTERLRRAELEIDEVRRDNKVAREDIRGLTQVIANMRKEGNLSKAKPQAKEKPLSGL